MKVPTPATRVGRIILGSLLIVGGVLGFLPVLGFWMIPLGVIFLSHDFPAVRRFRRLMESRLGRRWAMLKHRYGNGKAPKPGRQQKK